MNEFQLLTTDETETCIKNAKNGDEDAKQKLLNGNYPLIKSIVKRFVGKRVEYDDLYQLGCVGFLKAIKNYSSEFGVKFSTYAVPMIAGEIKRYMRDDGEIKIARSIKTLSIKINRFIDECKQNGKIVPTVVELAKIFEVDKDDIIIALDSNYCLVSLYEKTADKTDTSPNLIDKIASSPSLDNNLERIMLKDLIKNLPEREKKVIVLRYFRGKTQTEIAQMLNVSQVQISRIEAKVLLNFKEKLS